jgi:hypothetical protein
MPQRPLHQVKELEDLLKEAEGMGWTVTRVSDTPQCVAHAGSISGGTPNAVRSELRTQRKGMAQAHWLRTAIHATGGYTPGWEDSGPRQHAIVYEIDEAGVNVRPLESV